MVIINSRLILGMSCFKILYGQLSPICLHSEDGCTFLLYVCHCLAVVCVCVCVCVCMCVYVYVCVCVLCRVRLFATPWIIDCQASLSMGFPRQEYWSGLLFSSPGDLFHPGIKLASLALAGGFFTTEPPGKPFTCLFIWPCWVLVVPHGIFSCGVKL